MIVALFVLGVALTGIVRSLGFGVGVAGAAHRTMLARQLAASAAADLPVDRFAALAAAVAAGGQVDVDDVAIRCTRSVAGWEEGERAWFWIEVMCELPGPEPIGVSAGGPGGGGWRPGRATLLVAR